jgi:hypothetical protein
LKTDYGEPVVVVETLPLLPDAIVAINAAPMATPTTVMIVFVEKVCAC